jgi:hypothetical protein
MPPIAVQLQLNLILQQLNHMGQQLNTIQAGYAAFSAPVHAADAAYRQDLLPMRFQNAAASLDAPLHYPPNVPIPAQAPQTKHELMSLTGVSILLDILNLQSQLCSPDANCQIVAQALNLPALPNNASVAQRRQQVMDYLGCDITA